jgi:hypothetical protein
MKTQPCKNCDALREALKSIDSRLIRILSREDVTDAGLILELTRLQDIVRYAGMTDDS